MVFIWGWGNGVTILYFWLRQSVGCGSVGVWILSVKSQGLRFCSLEGLLGVLIGGECCCCT